MSTEHPSRPRGAPPLASRRPAGAVRTAPPELSELFAAARVATAAGPHLGVAARSRARLSIALALSAALHGAVLALALTAMASGPTVPLPPLLVVLGDARAGVEPSEPHATKPVPVPSPPRRSASAPSARAADDTRGAVPPRSATEEPTPSVPPSVPRDVVALAPPPASAPPVTMKEQVPPAPDRRPPQVDDRVTTARVVSEPSRSAVEDSAPPATVAPSVRGNRPPLDAARSGGLGGATRRITGPDVSSPGVPPGAGGAGATASSAARGGATPAGSAGPPASAPPAAAPPGETGPAAAGGAPGRGAAASSVTVARVAPAAPAEPRGGSAGDGGPVAATPEYDAYLRTLSRDIHRALTYPWLARRRGITGTVLVELTIQPTGEIDRVVVIESSSHDLLDRAALEAPRAIRARPFPPDVPRRALRWQLPIVFELK